ncbi:MAG TPA: ATP-binding protein [Thermoanaerobaculia bacterium]
MTIVCDAAAEEDIVSMDPRRLLHAFTNLVRNAVQYSPRGGTVTVRIEATEQSIVCTVSDEGPGFKPTELRQVFEPFFTRRKGGTGLGLAIARAVVEQHHGTITATNGTGGGGGVVSIELPVAAVVPA